MVAAPAAIFDAPGLRRLQRRPPGLDHWSAGVANVAWTDMRDTDPAFEEFQQFVHFARR